MDKSGRKMFNYDYLNLLITWLYHQRTQVLNFFLLDSCSKYHCRTKMALWIEDYYDFKLTFPQNKLILPFFLVCIALQGLFVPIFPQAFLRKSSTLHVDKKIIFKVKVMQTIYWFYYYWRFCVVEKMSAYPSILLINLFLQKHHKLTWDMAVKSTHTSANI